MFTKHALAAAGLALAFAMPAAQAQQKYEMKLAYFVGDQHAMSQWLIRWSEQLEKGSGGRLTVAVSQPAGAVEPAALSLSAASRSSRRR